MLQALIEAEANKRTPEVIERLFRNKNYLTINSYGDEDNLVTTFSSLKINKTTSEFQKEPVIWTAYDDKVDWSYSNNEFQKEFERMLFDIPTLYMLQKITNILLEIQKEIKLRMSYDVELIIKEVLLEYKESIPLENIEFINTEYKYNESHSRQSTYSLVIETYDRKAEIKIKLTSSRSFFTVQINDSYIRDYAAALQEKLDNITKLLIKSEFDIGITNKLDDSEELFWKIEEFLNSAKFKEAVSYY